MTTLDIWYYREDDPTGQHRPETVRNQEELTAVLDYVLTHDQPHPPVLVVRERLTVADGEFPDHQVKFDVDRNAGVGAILCQGPSDFAPDADPHDPDGGTWVTLGTGHPQYPPLFIDKATDTRFPDNAYVQLAVWREALGEILHTGRRPTNVAWQDSDIY